MYSPMQTVSIAVRQTYRACLRDIRCSTKLQAVIPVANTIEYPRKTQPTVGGSSANKPDRYWLPSSRRVSKNTNVGPNHKPTMAFIETHAGARRRTEFFLI